MAKFSCGRDHLSAHLHPNLAETHTTGGYTSGSNTDITDDTNTVNRISSNTSDDMDAVDHSSSDTSDDIDTINRINLDSSDDMDTTNHTHSGTSDDMNVGKHVGLGNSDDTGTGNNKSLETLNDVCAEANVVSSSIEESDAPIESNEDFLDSRKSSTAFTVDFGSDSSSGLSISDKLSRYLPKHVAQRVEQRASNVKVRSDRSKNLDKEDLLSESEKSLPASKGGHRKQTRDEANGKPDKRKSLPTVSLKRVDANPGKRPAVAPKKQANESKRTSLSHNAPSHSNPSSFRTPCRKFSCPLNQSSSRSAPLASNFRLVSPRLTDLNLSDSVDCMDSKTDDIKSDHLGTVRSNNSYTILCTAKRDEASDSISDSGTYEVDEEQPQRDAILKARQTISHVFGVESYPRRNTAKPKRLVQFTRSNAGRQSPDRKATTGRAVVRPPGIRVGSSSADANKSRLRCPVKGRGGQFGESKSGHSADTLGRSSSNNQSKKNSKVVTHRVNSVMAGKDSRPNSVMAGKDSRPNSRSSTISQPFKTGVCGFGVSTSDHVVVNSSSGRVAVSCPAVPRPSPAVTLRTNRTFELRCARLEASTADARTADEAPQLLLQKMRRRVPKVSTNRTQEASSHTSICSSRESGNSSAYGGRDVACTLSRGLKQNMYQSNCSLLLQEELLSPVDSLTSVTIDGSHTSLDTAQAKKSYVRKTSSLLATQLPRAREKAGLTFRDRFALDLPEVRAWHERHRTKTTPTKVVVLGKRKGPPGETTKNEQEKTRSLFGNNCTTSMPGTCRDSFSVSQAKNGNKLNALKMLLKMSEEITAKLRKMNGNQVPGMTVPPAQQQAVTNAMISAFKNCLQMEKDIQEMEKLFKM